MDPEARAGLADGVVQVLSQISKGLGPRAYTPVLTADERDLTTGERNLADGLKLAERWLGTAQTYLGAGSGSAMVVDDRVVAAAQALAAVRDTIGSHLGPDRRPLTAYAYLLRHQAAFDYLTHRYSEVAWAGGQLVSRLAQGVEHPGAAEAFEAARASSAGNFSVSTITNAQGDHLNVRKLDLDLHDLTASSLTGRSASANLVTGRLTIGYEDLSGVVSRLLADGGALTVAPDTGVGGGGSQEAALRITGTWNGRPLDTAASVAIAADEFELRVPELGGSRYTWRVPLPQNINFTAARSTQNGLELEATGHQVVLGR
ncbi:hypothetical protein NJL88_35270 [Streptomyces sp. DK15]|uniref:hypothetical protein n=1 Tax=Streptomyces sp. DK15 TaxID=2957499 RepID=UPI0029ABE3B2|nr:hypothetical protein [Streptomyces sp. DK15]MDX2395225.1 hypothetical protein [Streptomyces sp. DK15]